MLSVRYGSADGLQKGWNTSMKVSIEVGHGWCGAMAKCSFCGTEYTLIRERKKKAETVRCHVCKQIATIKEQETPWVGLIEEMR